MTIGHGARAWAAYPALSAPLTMMGVERGWFLLSATLGMAMWNAVNSIMIGAVSFCLLYGVGWWAWRTDPHMLTILRESVRFKTRYDPAKWGVVARIVTGPHDANRQDPHRPMRYDTGRPRAVIRFKISQPRTASLPCPAGFRARRPSPMMDL